MYNTDVFQFEHTVKSQTFVSGIARAHIVSYDIIRDHDKTFHGIKLKSILGDEFTLDEEEGKAFLDWYEG